MENKTSTIFEKGVKCPRCRASNIRFLRIESDRKVFQCQVVVCRQVFYKKLEIPKNLSMISNNPIIS